MSTVRADLDIGALRATVRKLQLGNFPSEPRYTGYGLDDERESLLKEEPESDFEEQQNFEPKVRGMFRYRRIQNP